MLNNRTALLFTASLDLILPVYTWIALAGQRTRATLWWCASGPLVGLGILLLVLRSMVPDFMSFNLGNLLVTAGFLVRIQSIRWQLGPPPRAGWILWVLAFYFVCHGLLLNQPTLLPSVAYVRGVLGILSAVTAFMSWKFALREPGNNIHAMTLSFSLLSLAVFVQFAQTLGTPAAVYLFVPGYWPAELVTAMGQITAVVSYFCFVGLMLERAQRAQVQTAAELARADAAQQLQQQLTQLSQQDSLNVMSATLGHEISQPLTAMLTNAQVAQRALRTGRGTPALLLDLYTKIALNATRARQIIERVQNFTRPGKLNHTVLSLDHWVHDALHLMEQEILRQRVQVSFAPPSTPIKVLGDPIQLSQVLTNVLRNALAAMHDSTLRQIHIHCTQSGDQARLCLRDTGPGLSDDQLQKVGQPFYTTKSTGLGMGLSISRAILSQHGGALTLRNAEEGGAVTELELPLFHERRNR